MIDVLGNDVIIEKIFWKRTYLFIEYLSVDPLDLYIANGNERIGLNSKKIDESRYRAKINLCVTEKREMLKEGIWEISVTNTNRFEISEDILFNIENLSNVFRYDGDKAYIVTFHVTEKNNITGLSFMIDYMKRNRKPKRRIDSLFWKKKFINFYYSVVHNVVGVLFSKKRKRILFSSQNRTDMVGNLKAINQRLFERELDKLFSINYSFENVLMGKKSVFYWLDIIIKIACSDYIFVEDYIPVFSFLKLNRKTCLIQVWHAGFGFKAVGYGRFGLDGSPHPFQSCHRKYTYALIGNDYLREVYTEVFGIERQALLATGMPRLDHFLDEDIIENSRNEFYKKYPKFQEKNIIIFAPTYRGSNQREAYYDFGKINQKALYEYCKKSNSIVIFKFHYFINSKINIEKKYREYFFDFSDYDLHELFYVGDLLITDYSSCFYDFILLEKPVIFYIFDEAFFSASRGVHRTVSKTVPGKICRTFDELIILLDEYEFLDNKHCEVPRFLIDKCKIDREVCASDKVIDFILLNKEVPGICQK